MSTSPTGSQALDIELLYREHGHAVLRRIRRFYRNPDTAEEVLHEVFERAIVRGASFRGDSHPLTWLYQVTTRHCLNRLRDAKRRTALLDENPGALGPLSASPSQEAEVFLRQLWHKLDEELAVIGTYYYVDGMTQAQIGKLLGVTGRTISNRLATLTALARELADADPAEGE